MSILGIPEHTAELARHREALRANTVATAALAKAVAGLNRTLERFIPPRAPKGPLTFTYKGKGSMGLLFDVSLPQFADAHDPAAEDVTHGELTLTYDGVDQPVIETTVSHDPTNGATAQASIVDLEVPAGIMLGARFDFRDDDGNVSGQPVIMAPFKTDQAELPPVPVGGLGFTFKGVKPEPTT